MSLEAAKQWLGHYWVHHPAYQPQPHHSNYARVDVAVTFMRVRHRMRHEGSFIGAVEQTKQRLRMVYKGAA